MATVRRVQTRADGSCDTSEAVVQANHRAAPNVDTATSVAAADMRPDRYNDHASTGNSPLTTDGVDRASTWVEISRRWRSLRVRSSCARWARTGPVAPDSFTVRAADSEDTRAVTNSARAATVRRPDRSSTGPKPVATTPERAIVPAKNSAGSALRDTIVVVSRMNTHANWSMRLSASTTTRSVSPAWATTSAGVCALTRRG